MSCKHSTFKTTIIVLKTLAVVLLLGTNVTTLFITNDTINADLLSSINLIALNIILNAFLLELLPQSEPTVRSQSEKVKVSTEVTA